jgi:hypothetical protein
MRARALLQRSHNLLIDPTHQKISHCAPRLL